jgi:hypothetical protein
MCRIRILTLLAAGAVGALTAFGFVPAVADAMHSMALVPATESAKDYAPPSLGRVEFATDFIQ